MNSSKPRFARARRGTTLLEVATVSLLFVTLLGGMVTMGINTAGQYSRDSSRMMADGDASLALQALSRDARNGIRASVNTGGTELTIVMPVVNAAGDYDRFVEGASVRYYLNTTTRKLFRQQGTNAARVLGSNITAVSFAVNGPQVQVTLTARQQHGSKAKQSVLKSQITLRNVPPQ
jgi:hypothetical protein